jgi:type I restriction enzyme M protein
MPNVAKVIVIPEGKICDYVDGTFRNDTPEEYVRQTIEKRLINEHKYLPKQVKIEYTLQLGSSKKRADIVIFDKKGPSLTQENVRIIIECKKETIEPSSIKDGVAQLESYMSACPNCEWGMWTNGMQKEVYRKVLSQTGQIAFEDFNDIPSADGDLGDIDRPDRKNLKNAYDDNLLFVFKTCHNHIYANDGLQKQPAFFELLKVIFCKIEDERNIPNPLEFYATSKERNNIDGQLTVQKRISKIFDQVKKKHGKIFSKNEVIELKPRSLAYIVSELQKYSLLNTNIDIKGKAYEEIVGANLRGDRGEFFTPRNIMKMVVEMINPKLDERVLDSSCGTGGFLVNAMNHVIAILDEQFSKEIGKPKIKWNIDSLRAFQDRVGEMAKTNYFGFDINPDLVKATKMNMVMNNDGSGNILQTNSLLPPHEWTDEFRSKLAEALQIDKASIRNKDTFGLFDVIVTNPPFGSKIPIKEALHHKVWV